MQDLTMQWDAPPPPEPPRPVGAAIAGATQMPIRPAAADVILQDRETPLLDEALTSSFEFESIHARPTDLTLTAVETTADERDRALNQLSEEDWKELEI